MNRGPNFGFGQSHRFPVHMISLLKVGLGFCSSRHSWVTRGIRIAAEVELKEGETAQCKQVSPLIFQELLVHVFMICNFNYPLCNDEPLRVLLVTTR